MASTRFVLPAALALAGCLVDAHPMNLNPFTPGGDTIEMGVDHPARGLAPNKGSLALKAAMPKAETVGADSDELAGWLNKSTTIVAKATTNSGEVREATEQNSKDLQRLEAHFKTKMVVNYKELTKYNSAAAASPPWPSSYWAIYEDGINYRWNDGMPASEKYARAFGQDPKAFVDKVSQVNGVLSQATRQNCTADADCAALKDGSGCGKRYGEKTGVCIPKWFGICHAWAPAAIEEREPRCAVTKNNITFEPLDIKALITQAYDGSHLETVFTGTRFNGADEPLNMDEDGRFIDATRRDIGPGFFHVAIHNIMGIFKKSFIIDVTAGAEVWNQPVRSYEVISQTELTPEFAAQTFFPPRTTYIFNKEAKKIVFIQLKFSWVVESNDNGPMIPQIDKYTQSAYYEYILELNDSGDIIGGEWVRNSRKEHPDFLWFPKGQPPVESVDNIGIKYKEVRQLLDASADCKQLPADGSTLAPVTNAPEPTAPPSTSPPSATPAPSTTAPTPSTTAPAPSAPGQANDADGSIGNDAGSVGKDDDDDDDDDDGDVNPPPSTVPQPTSAKPTTTPTVTAKPTATPTPKPADPPAVVPIPTPAPVPAPAPSGKPSKGTTAPLVPAPPSTTAPPNVVIIKPDPTPPADPVIPGGASSDDDDSVDSESDITPSTLPPAPTPSPSKKSKCGAV